jgi:hypothetical protein
MNGRYPILFFFFCVALLGCKSNPTSPSNSVGTGNGEINGYANLYDTNGVVMNDHSGIAVSVENGSQTTITDSDGQFTLMGIPNATFTLIFSKPGFAESHHIDYIYKDTSTLQYYGLRKLFQTRRLTPDIVLRPFEGGDTNNPYQLAMFSSRILDTLKNQQYSGLIKLYFGHDASVSPQNPNSFEYMTPLAMVDAQDGTANIAVFRDSLLNYGFQEGTQIYVQAYVTGFYTENQFYIDKASGKRMYTGLSPFSSELKSFVLP